MYWGYVLSQDATVKCLASAKPTDYAVDAIGPSFVRGMLAVTVADYIASAEEMLLRTRLHLLVVCSANVEAYSKEITFAHLASKGHSRSHLKLDAIGDALGAPILDRSSLPNPLEYAEILFQVVLGKSRAVEPFLQAALRACTQRQRPYCQDATGDPNPQASS